MAEPVPTHEPLLSPERINTGEFTAVYGRIGLSLKTGDNKIFDRNKKDIPTVAKEQFETNLDNQNFDVADSASTRERREEAKGKTAKEWIQEHVPIFKQNFHNIEGFNEESAERWESFVCKLFGVQNQNQIDVTNVRAFYETYCGDKTNTGAFVKKLLQIYGGDFRQIESNRDVIQWISKAFGIEYAQLEISLHHSLIQERLKDTQVDALVTEVNDIPFGETLSRINRPNDRNEIPICEYLYKGGAPLETKPGKPTTPPSPDDGTKPPDGKKDETAPTTETENSAVKKIAELLSTVKEPVNKDINPHYIDNPTYPFHLSKDQLQKLALLKKSFFVWHEGYAGPGIYSNPEVIPLADTLGKDARLRAVEDLTKGDSGLLGLAGISSETPEKQAKLYMGLVENILSFHEQNQMSLLKWLAVQKMPFSKLPKNVGIPNHIKCPLDIFVENDHEIKDGKRQLRPGGEALLRYDAKGDLDIFRPEFMNEWKVKIAVLRDAIETGELGPTHLRWIEFLSHSVDVMEMMKMMSEAKINPSVVSNVDAKENQSQLGKSFGEYRILTNRLDELKKEMKEREKEVNKDKDDFAHLTDSKYVKISEDAEKIKLQLDQINHQIADFEINQLPAILGGTFDTIIANPKDERQEVHGYYYGGFRSAFRQYMLNYISLGQGVDSKDLRSAYEKLKEGLNAIDSNVKLVEFDSFINSIVSALSSGSNKNNQS